MPKLIRDLIPAIMRETGRQANTYIASEEEYGRLLGEKLQEEVDEFLEEESIEELADILEVLDAIMAFKKLDKKMVEEVQRAKRQKRGAFLQRMVLE